MGFILISVIFTGATPQFALDTHLKELYWQADFSEILIQFEKKSPSDFEMDDRFLAIECLARTGRGLAAQRKLEKIVPEDRFRKNFLSCWGWSYLSRGRFKKSEQYINRALEIDDRYPNAVIAKVMLLLYLKQYGKAEALFERWLEKSPRFFLCFQSFLVGIEVYNATRNIPKLRRWYSLRAKNIKNQDLLTYQNLKSSSRLYKRLRKKNLFEVQAESDSVELPLVGFSDQRFYCLLLKLSNRDPFKILLDSGNATGWIIHDRELYDLLDVKRGGRTTAFIGSEADSLDGYRITTREIDFGPIRLRHLTGFYIPKPRSDFFDASFNPTFIRNRVVTLDGPGKRLILRTKIAFDRYLAKKQSTRRETFPWYGYEHVFIPLEINGVPGLGNIETGAKDVAVLLDFARLLKLPLKPEVGFLSNGTVYRFFKTPVNLRLGILVLKRPEAEVWSFDRFYRRLSGLKADVVLGPDVFREQFIVSFDPFENTIVMEW